jgi:glutaredoxin|tara:strand:- start:779 stop:1015 length:237 start_codon:yes stop_codon:yes gene_type:complete
MKAVVYSRDNCQWCDRVRQLFASIDIDYIEYKLDKDFTREQFILEFEEAATFPQVSINNKAIGGCKETLKYLQDREMI